MAAQESAGIVDPAQPRGALNRATPISFRLKAFFRGIKIRTNRKLYYTIKYSLGALALYALLVLVVLRGT